jgi:hypothetical protein
MMYFDGPKDCKVQEQDRYWYDHKEINWNMCCGWVFRMHQTMKLNTRPCCTVWGWQKLAVNSPQNLRRFKSSGTAGNESLWCVKW